MTSADLSRQASMSTPTLRTHRLAWIPVLVVGVLLFELVRHTLISTHNPNLVPALILLGAAVIPAAFVTLIYGMRLAYDVPAGVLAVTAFLGGVIGIVVAGTLEYDTVRDLGTLPMAGVGLIEETAKLLVPVALLVWGRFRRPADGLLIGVACGAGFAVLETMGYAFVEVINRKGDLAAVDGILVLRGLLSPAAHMAWTGLAAAALWIAAAQHWHGAATLRLVGTFVVAVGLHTAWDSIGTLGGYIVIAVLGLTALWWTARDLRRQEEGTTARLTTRRPGG